jgi:hypothetical protein
VLMKWGFRTKKSLEACLLLGKSETLLWRHHNLKRSQLMKKEDKTNKLLMTWLSWFATLRICTRRQRKTMYNNFKSNLRDSKYRSYGSTKYKLKKPTWYICCEAIHYISNCREPIKENNYKREEKDNKDSRNNPRTRRRTRTSRVIQDTSLEATLVKVASSKSETNSDSSSDDE